MAIAFVGYNMVHQFERVIFPFLGLVFAACCLYIFGHTNAHLGFNAAAPAAAGGQVGAFILAVFFAYAYAVSWNPYGADYARYLPRSTPALRVALAAGLGIFVSCAVLEVAGAGLATVMGTSWGPNDVPTDQFVKPLPEALGLIATVAIALGAIAANVLNLYSAAMSFLTLGIRLTLRRRRAIVAVGFGVIGFCVGLTGSAAPGSKYEAFLFFNTYWIVPFIAVVLIDWALRRGRYREASSSTRATGRGRARSPCSPGSRRHSPSGTRRCSSGWCRRTRRSSATSASWSGVRRSRVVAVACALRPLDEATARGVHGQRAAGAPTPRGR